MATEKHPFKIQRRELFLDALAAAELMRETRANTRLPRQRAPRRRTTYTPDQARLREANFLELLKHRYEPLPLVALELVETSVEEQKEAGKNPIEVGEFLRETPLYLAAGALAVMATGLDTFVRTRFEERELWAGPDDHYQDVATRFTVSRVPLEDARAFKQALQRPSSEPRLFDS